MITLKNDDGDTSAIFIIVIARCVYDWILELFSNFRALCESMHDFSCIVEITIATATPTML